MVQHPLAWITLLYALGIWAGRLAQPWLTNELLTNGDPRWLLLSVLPLCVLCLHSGLGRLKKKRKKVRFDRLPPQEPIADVFLLLFWFMLGFGRMAADLDFSITSLASSYLPTFETTSALWRANLIQRLNDSGMQGETLDIAAALLLGEKCAIPPEVRQTFSLVGASHLLALSGLHLGILYGLLHMLFIRWIRFSAWRWFFFPLMLLIIWGYVMLTGWPGSLVRAALMLSLVTLGSFGELYMPAHHTLTFSAFIILLKSPTALFDVGLQLSFAATLFIVVLYLPLKDALTWGALKLPYSNAFPWRVVRWAGSVVGVSVAAVLGTAPLVMHYFGSFPLLSPLFSIVLIPLTTLIVGTGALALLFPLPFLTTTLAEEIKSMTYIISQCARIPSATLTITPPPVWMMVLWYVLLLCATVRLRDWLEREHEATMGFNL